MNSEKYLTEELDVESTKQDWMLTKTMSVWWVGTSS
jgi:hypothetical protein